LGMNWNLARMRLPGATVVRPEVPVKSRETL
jgi:hypothetical protein